MESTSLNHVVTEKIKELRRELTKSKSIDALIILDVIETNRNGIEMHSCPICGEVLEPVQDYGYWTCRGSYHGVPITFSGSSKCCGWCDKDGPFCTFAGYCLAQRFVAYGKPKICIVGRIDDQSPR